jgi:hypothetical protein
MAAHSALAGRPLSGLGTSSRIRVINGEVPERSIGAVSKTVVPFAGYRGFESLPLRTQ